MSVRILWDVVLVILAINVVGVMAGVVAGYVKRRTKMNKGQRW